MTFAVATLEASYDAAIHSAAGVVVDVDVVEVRGPDALSYLQTQCSQDLAKLQLGESCDSLVLSPQGKLDAYVRVVRIEEDAAIVVVDSGYGEHTLERLRRFRLRVKAELTLGSSRALVLRGPQARDAAPAGAPQLLVDWGIENGVDVVGAHVELPSGVLAADPAALAALRIEAGRPVMGAELTEKTIAQESGLTTRAVSFTKGCYPGQELVARIDARGDNVAKRLVGLLLGSESAPVGASFVYGEKTVGSLTSVAYSPARGVVALGYLGRGVATPAEVLVEVTDGAVIPAQAVELPIG